MTAQRASTPDPIAPWAEIVPNMPPMTVDDLHAIPDDGWMYELVKGVLVRMPLSGGEASNIGLLLGSRLSVYVEDNGLGRVTGEQGGYRLDPAHPRDTELGPDYAFVRADRLPPRTSPEYSKAWQLAPLRSSTAITDIGSRPASRGVSVHDGLTAYRSNAGRQWHDCNHVP